MFRGDWYQRASLGLAIVFVLIVGGLLLKQHCDGGRCYYRSAEKVAYEAALRALLTEPPHRQTNPERGEWRAEADLRAQRDMARWAKWMFVSSSLGVIATALGVVYVARTLKLTRELALGEQRPWLGEKSEFVSVDIAEGDDVTLSVNVLVRNSGQQPALHVVVRVFEVPDAGVAAVPESMKSALVRHVRGDVEVAGQTIFPNSEELFSRWVFLRLRASDSHTDFRGYIGGWIEYRFHGSDTPHLTPFLYNIGYIRIDSVERKHLQREPHGLRAT